MARFQREAEVVASLDHPNIAQIDRLERSGGTIALVRCAACNRRSVGDVGRFLGFVQAGACGAAESARAQ